jgi:hypothetical protein
MLQRLHQDIGVARPKDVGRSLAGWHGHAARSDRAAAIDIVKRVADDDHLTDFRRFAITSSGQYQTTEMQFGGCQRRRRDIAPFHVLVAKAAEREPMQESVVRQLSPGSFADIARQQAQSNIAAGRKCRQEVFHSRQHKALVRGEGLVQPAQITRRESLPVFRGRFYVVCVQQFHRDSSIAAPGKGNFCLDFGDAEFFDERLRKGRLPGAASKQECAVDVEQTNVHGRLRVECRELRARIEPLLKRRNYRVAGLPRVVQAFLPCQSILATTSLAKWLAFYYSHALNPQPSTLHPEHSMKQAVAGVAPAQLQEVTAMVVWPSLSATSFGRLWGRLFGIEWGFRLFGVPITVGRLAALASIPFMLALYFLMRLPLPRFLFVLFGIQNPFCWQYRLTNRRLVMENPFGGEIKAVSLDRFDSIETVVEPGQAWFKAGDLVFRQGATETFRIAGVPRPETFRHTCLKARMSYVGVQQARTAGVAV